MVPLYRQLEDDLRQRIDSGELAPGVRLPPETELARRWQVNRLTVRQAISELARGGRVTVRRGAGTFVAQTPLVVEVDLPPLPTMAAEATSSEAFAAQGLAPRETFIGTRLGGTATAAAALGTTPEALRRIDTVIADDHSPWMASSYWVPDARFPGLANLMAGESRLYALVREHFSVRLRYDWRSLLATSASRDDAELLDVPPGTPVMLREGVNVDDTGTPTVFLSRRTRGDRLKYLLRYDTTDA